MTTQNKQAATPADDVLEASLRYACSLAPKPEGVK